MWSLLGAPYTDAGNSQTDDEAVCSADVSQWLHYDVPMEPCTWTHGVQVEAGRARNTAPDTTTADVPSPWCGWDSSVAGGACVPMPMAAPGSVTSLTHMLHPTRPTAMPSLRGDDHAVRLHVRGGLRLFLEGKCISGTPDHPSDQTVTVVDDQGLPNKGCPRDIDDNPLGK